MFQEDHLYFKLLLEEFLRGYCIVPFLQHIMFLGGKSKGNNSLSLLGLHASNSSNMNTPGTCESTAAIDLLGLILPIDFGKDC